MRNARLHVVVDSENPEVIEEVKQDLKEIEPALSCSPAREQPSLNHCSEFYATGKLNEEQYDHLYKVLNNDWDGEKDDCAAYGFNTKMFNPHVYYLQMEY